MLEPVIPEPIITYFADFGSVDVERRSAIRWGFLCQYDFVGLGWGNPVIGGAEPPMVEDS